LDAIQSHHISLARPGIFTLLRNDYDTTAPSFQYRKSGVERSNAWPTNSAGPPR
jgi:hypothetical protein